MGNYEQGPYTLVIEVGSFVCCRRVGEHCAQAVDAVGF